MPWKQLTEDTYYYPGTTNVGYHKGIVIDAGESVPTAEKMALELLDMGLEIRWLINTHGHPDHCGGNAGFVKHGAKLVAFDYQTGFMMDLKLPTHFMYGAEVTFGEHRRFRFPDAESVYPDRIERTGVIELDGVRLNIERHHGHAIDQITIQTPDNVLFIGDILLPMGMVKRTSSQTLFSVIQQMKDLEWLKNTSHNFYVPGHGKPMQSVSKLAEANAELQHKYINEVYAFCEEPRTREEIAAHLIQKYHWPDSMSGTSIVYNAAGAYIMLLESEAKMKIYNKNGYTYYKSLKPET